MESEVASNETCPANQTNVHNVEHEIVRTVVSERDVLGGSINGVSLCQMVSMSRVSPHFDDLLDGSY